jgi:broad specificity phosphatase PhoE
MKLYLLRHEESKAQTEEQFSFDSDLSEYGIKSLSSVSGELSFDRVYISPLRRCRQTYENLSIVSDEVFFDARLVEELPPNTYREYLFPYEELPVYASETLFEDWDLHIEERVSSFYNKELLPVLNKEVTVLIIAHAGTFSYLAKKIFITNKNMEIKFKIFNGAISLLEFDENSVVTLNYWNIKLNQLESLGK